MATAEITVSFVNPAAAGKKNGSIKTKDDDFYLVAPEMLDQFEPKGQYKVTYKTSTFKGVTYKFIEKVEPIAATAGFAAPDRNKPGARYQDDMVVAERIFVCGAINNMMANQNLDPRGLSADDIAEQVNKLRAVWGRTFGNPQKSADLDDEIPF